jgi:hypothetical protein
MSNQSDAQRLAAALEQLEAERRRREDEKVAAGEAVRVPAPVAIAREGEDVAPPSRASKRERLRGYERTVKGARLYSRNRTFPQSGLACRAIAGFGNWKHEFFEAFPDRYATTTTTPPRKEAPAPNKPASLEWKRIQTQFSPPDERSCGIIIEGARAVAGNQLHVRDHAGQIWVTPLNGDPDVQARRLLREKYGKNHAFNAPIRYPPRSYH